MVDQNNVSNIDTKLFDSISHDFQQAWDRDLQALDQLHFHEIEGTIDIEKVTNRFYKALTFLLKYLCENPPLQLGDISDILLY